MAQQNRPASRQGLCVRLQVMGQFVWRGCRDPFPLIDLILQAVRLAAQRTFAMFLLLRPKELESLSIWHLYGFQKGSDEECVLLCASLAIGEDPLLVDLPALPFEILPHDEFEADCESA